MLIGFFTEYFTSDTYKPTQTLADKSETGSATIIIGGLGLGMLFHGCPDYIIAICVMAAYALSGGFTESTRGLYGIALAAVGMLSTLGITLATDAYGPIADNAGGIAEMAGLDAGSQKTYRCSGFSRKYNSCYGKGICNRISSSYSPCPDCFLCRESAGSRRADIALDMSVMNPTVLVGIFIGACLPFVFAALTMDSVGRAAQSIVVEVRRQFREIRGLMEGRADADYERCVDICTRRPLHEMILPTLLAIITPVVTGLILGYNGVIGLLTGATATGFLMAIFMANAGGAWDNAKKYIEGRCPWRKRKRTAQSGCCR